MVMSGEQNYPYFKTVVGFKSGPLDEQFNGLPLDHDSLNALKSLLLYYVPDVAAYSHIRQFHEVFIVNN